MNKIMEMVRNDPPANNGGGQGNTTPPANNGGGQGNTTPPANNGGGQGNTTPPANNGGGQGNTTLQLIMEEVRKYNSTSDHTTGDWR